jgi:hypothetical protein
MDDFDGRNQVVGKVLGRDVTRGQLSVAFDAVADKANWKNPIDATVDLDDYTKAMVAEAIVFFTGSVAKFTRKGGTTTDGIGRYRVRAAGYYRTIGA